MWSTARPANVATTSETTSANRAGARTRLSPGTERSASKGQGTLPAGAGPKLSARATTPTAPSVTQTSRRPPGARRAATTAPQHASKQHVQPRNRVCSPKLQRGAWLPCAINHWPDHVARAGTRYDAQSAALCRISSTGPGAAPTYGCANASRTAATPTPASATASSRRQSPARTAGQRHGPTHTRWATSVRTARYHDARQTASAASAQHASHHARGCVRQRSRQTRLNGRPNIHNSCRCPTCWIRTMLQALKRPAASAPAAPTPAWRARTNTASTSRGKDASHARLWTSAGLAPSRCRGSVGSAMPARCSEYASVCSSGWKMFASQ